MMLSEPTIELDQPINPSVHRIITAEGVPLDFPRADMGERIVALILDLFFLIVFCVVIALLVVSGQRGGLNEDLMDSFGALALVSLRLLFFMVMEVFLHGRTPGKRIMSLRVIDRLGGPLTTKALVVRNLSREVELFSPILLSLGWMISYAEEWPSTSMFVWAAMVLWMAAFALFPLFNQDRLRLGDLIAGTMVVRRPDQALLPDLAIEQQEKSYHFSHDHLNVYGIHELEYLAAALRSQGDQRTEILAEIAVRISAKITWPDTVSPDQAEAFLSAYYQALRAHLEQGALFGKRRLSKHDQA